MKFLSFLLVTMFTLCGVNAFAGTNAAEYRAAFQFNHSSGFQNNLLGSKIIRDNMRDLKVQYNFAKTGGAIGTQNLAYPNDPSVPGASTSMQLPKNALVFGCYIDVITAPTSGGSPTIALSTGQSAGDLKAATAFGSFTGIVACIPVGTAATAIKMTADRTMTVTIATAALTGGVFNVHVQYVLSDQ